MSTSPPDTSPGGPLQVPVVLVSFNRPEHTRRMLAAIRAVAPARLFLLADGPRPGNAADVESCAAVRAALAEVDWPCEVKRLYRDVNIGAPASVAYGLDWVFGEVEEAIVLEDDCLPNPDFFRFCAELLERYRDNPDVWMIGGRAPNVAPEAFAGASYGFTAFAAIWGWATWRRAWEAHRGRSARHDEGPAAGPDMSSSRLLTPGARRYFADVASQSTTVSFGWDSYWVLSIVAERGLAIVPAANLVVNIGFGAGATNTRGVIAGRGLETLDWPLHHPARVELNVAIERYGEQLLTQQFGRLQRYLARTLGGTSVGRLLGAGARVWRNARTRASLPDRSPAP